MSSNRTLTSSRAVKLMGVFCGLLLAMMVMAPASHAGDKAKTPGAGQKKAVESAVKALAKAMKAQPPSAEATYDLLIAHLKANPGILGATLAFAPKKVNGQTIKTAPYVYVKDGQYIKKDLAAEGDYLAEEWYAKPVRIKKPSWSKPYFDNLGAHADMITYSIPIYTGKASNKLLGVLTSDLAIK